MIYFLFIFAIGEVTGSLRCPNLSTPQYGTWFCQDSTTSKTCHLECDPGYAATSATMTTCQSTSWSPSPSSMTCIPAVALVTGGLVASTTAELYGPSVHKRLTDLPDSRVGHTLDYVDGVVLACGGSTMTGPPVDPPPPSLSTCIQMAPDLTWSPHSSMAYTRDIAASAVNLGRITILGGTDFPDKRETMAPSIQTTWKEEMIEETKYTCGAKISPEEFLATGGAYSPGTAVSYNAVTGRRTELQNLTQPRSGHGCALVKAGGMAGVMVAGGFPDGGAMWTVDVSRATTNHTEFYDIKTGEWKSMGGLNMARRGLKLVFVEDALYAMGGFNGTEYVSTVEQFDFDSQTWRYVEDMFEARAFPGVVAVPNTWFSPNGGPKPSKEKRPGLIKTILCTLLFNIPPCCRN